MKMKITEAQLKQLIRESLDEIMDEEDMDEGFFGNLWGGVKNAAQSTGQGIAQRVNKMAADYNAGAAQNAQKDIEAQIQKSQEVIAKEQQKINNLRAKYNQYVQKSDQYMQKANANAQNRGSNTRYQGYGMQQDNQNQDFFTKGDMNKAKFSSRMAGAQQAHNKMRRQQNPQQMVAEDWWDQGAPHGYGSNDHYGSHGDEYFYNSGPHRSAWDLNESKLDKIIKESIKKHLKK